MTANSRRSAFLMALLLLYCCGMMCWGAFKNPLIPDEARNIFTGRAAIKEFGSKHSGLMVDEYLGSAAIAPVAIAKAESIAGIRGARLVGVALCLLIVCSLYLVGNTQPHGGRGLITASTFVFLGIPLQLSSIANSDAYAAAFLGASFLCVEHAAGLGSSRKKAFMLLTGALSLAFAVMANYIAFLFIAPFILFVFLRHQSLFTIKFFLLPFVILLALYAQFAIRPVWPRIAKELALAYTESTDSSWTYVFGLLTMSYLLAAMGIFHKDGAKTSFLMLMLASPALIIHFFSSHLGEMNSAAFFSLIFLSPAAARGVEHMGDLFSYDNDIKFVKSFFVAAILAVIWVFGVQQIKELKLEHPDFSNVISFLKKQGKGCSSLLVDSDYGSPELVYEYYFDSKAPSMRIIPVVRENAEKRREIVESQHPDYAVVDSYYNVRSFKQACSDYMADGYDVAATWDITTRNMSRASRLNNIIIFKKGAL